MPSHVSLQDDLASHYALSSITSMWVCSYFVNGCMVFVESQLSSLAVEVVTSEIFRGEGSPKPRVMFGKCAKQLPRPTIVQIRADS